jgi:mannose-1-phosphate guanylyltransferase
VTLPSDHLILRESEFHSVILKGLEFVEGGDRLLTIGLKPTSPHTGYGYIQRGEPVGDAGDIMKVKSFTEKPNLEMAKVFLSTGEFFWNSGMFMWRADSILRAFDKYDPETATIFDAGEGAFGTPGEMVFIDKAFPNAPSISIDYAIMEKADNVYVETADLGWSDLGTWNALYDCSPKTPERNVTQNCKVMAHDCEGTLFAASPDKIVVAAGLKDYIVADRGNALLIYPLAEEQKIRQVVNEVLARFGEDYV